MAKEIQLYSSIFSYTAERFIGQLNEAKDEEVEVNLDCNGGDPQSSFGMIRAFQKRKKDTTLNVQGRAFSMAAFFACYVSHATALDVSEFLFHRAAMPDYIERDSELFDVDSKKRLDKINSHLRDALEAKIDVVKFERITNTTLDQLFSMDGRIDVTLSAKQAKKIGLIEKVIPITPEIRASVDSVRNSEATLIAAHVSGGEDFSEAIDTSIVVKKKEQTKEQTIDKKMDIQKLKTEHPSVYAEIEALGKNQGVKEEKQRVETFLVFAKVDLTSVIEGLKGTEAMSPAQMAEFVQKSANAKYLQEAEASSQGEVATKEGKVEKGTETEIKASSDLEAFRAEVKKNLSL